MTAARNDRAPGICLPGISTIPKILVQEALGKELRRSRTTTGISQATVSERIHVNPSTVSAMERGKMLPSISLLLRYCAAIRYPLSAVLLTLEHDLQLNNYRN